MHATHIWGIRDIARCLSRRGSISLSPFFPSSRRLSSTSAPPRPSSSPLLLPCPVARMVVPVPLDH